MALASRRYLVDTSAFNRLRQSAVGGILSPLRDAGLIVTCPLVDLELLYSTQSPKDYKQQARYRRAYPSLPITPDVCERAMAVQAALAALSRHRGASIPDLLIAACAELHDAVVLHYDADYELIASITGQPVRAIAPLGSL